MIISTNIIIAIICLLILIIFLVYKKFSTRKNISSISINEQAVYSSQTNPKNNDKKLSLKEKIELSWKFLYEITEIIINKFSKEDVDLVSSCGRLLLNNGGKYEHIVDLALQRNVKSQTQAIEQNQSKGQARGA